MSQAIHKMRTSPPVVIVGSVAGTVSSANGTTHSLGNIDVGSGGKRHAIMLLTWEDPGAITSFTVGGVTLTERTHVDASNNQSGIYTADVSSISGSQAISVTFASSVDSVGVSGVSVSGLQSEVPRMSDTDSSTGAGTTLTLTALAAQPGGIAVGCANYQADGETWSWSDLSERADVATGGDAEDHRHTAAWDLGQRTAADETLTITSGGGGRRSAVGAGFR